MGLYLLVELNKIIHVIDYDQYREDGSIVVFDKRKENDRIRKTLFNVFNELTFDIEFERNLKFVQYLNIELNLINKIVSPYTKPNSRQTLCKQYAEPP